ncbi:heme exporter protein D [Variovorax sp. GrIS 2.14]
MEIFGFTFTAFLFWKLVALCVLAFIVNFVYTLKTGRSLTDDRNRLRREQSATSTTQALDRVDR